MAEERSRRPTLNSRTLSRRTLLKRGAVAGGLVWAAPAIATIARADAVGAGSPAPCDCTFCATVNPPVGSPLYFDCGGATPDDCNCLCACAGVGSPCSHPSDPCAVTVVCAPRATPC